MQEAEEQDTCRICSAPAEPDQPLFHPCKCSGTIRYIHQDCLTTWLAHSKKKTCDLCKHQYAFTKVYAPDMPSSLPPFLMARRLIQQAFYMMLLGLRAIAVTVVWLAVVPLITVWSWRFYFSMGDSTAWWISNRTIESMPNPPKDSLLSHQFIELTLAYFSDTSPPPSYNTTMEQVIGRTFNHPAWLALSADIFTGQIIASLIVVTFVAIFLLREWIAQNARPGVFDDEEIPAPNPNQDVLQVPPAAQAPAVQRRNALPGVRGDDDPNGPAEVAAPRQRMDVNARLALAQRQLEAVRALDALRTVERENKVLNEDEELARVQRAQRLGRSAIEFAPPRGEEMEEELDRVAAKARRRRIEKRKMKEEGSGLEPDFGDVKQERLKRRSFARRLHIARQSGARWRQEMGSLPVPDGAFEGKGLQQSISQSPGSDSTLSSSSSNPTPRSSVSPSPAFFPDVPLERPNEPIPFSFVFRPPLSTATDPTLGTTSLTSSSPAVSSSSATSAPAIQSHTFSMPLDELDSQLSGSTSTPSSSVRRPPLPSTIPSTPGGSSVFPGMMTPGSGPSTPRKSPLSSPGIATYRAPEELAELEADGYFDNAGDGPILVEVVNIQEVGADEEDDGDITLDEDNAGDEGQENKRADDGDEDGAAIDGGELDRYFRDVTEEEAEGESDDEDEEQMEEPLPGAPLVAMEDVDEDEDEDDEEEDEDEEEVEFEGEDGEDEDHARRRRRHAHAQRVLGQEFAAGAAVRAGQAAADGNRLLPIQGPQLPPQQLQGPARGIADEEAMIVEELEAGVEDDMDGAMEAIGMRGPILGLFQNAGLMILVMDTAIGVGVWVPFTIGKSTALLSLEPRRLFYILHLPIQAIRLITDPAVDFVAFLLTDVVFPPYLRMAKQVGQWFLTFTFWIIAKVLGTVKAGKARDACLATYSLVEDLAKRPMELLGLPGASVEIASPPPPTPTSFASDVSFISNLVPEFVLDAAEPYFAPLGKEVRSGSAKLRETWTQLALGQGPGERVFSVALGYCMVAFVLMLYLNILTVGNVRTAGRAVRTAVRQQLLVLKVATFIFIELVTFPLGCGVVLDFCTIWLFPGSTLVSRTSFLYQAPLTAIFYHWVAGTMFMYSFAVLLSGCRSVMRSGAMWFIKDPQDQNSHPIRDILDRPALIQLRKICVSGVMYSFVVACTVGSIAALLVIGNKIVLPFRWKTREPLSNVPVDLLFLHLVLPYTMSYFRPRKSLKKIATAVWKALARRLRLTSYFFGGRHGEEEHTLRNWSFKALIHGPSPSTEALAADYDGTFRRVPATDDIAIPREMRATVAVTSTGEAVDDAARNLMEQQDAETIKAKRNIKHDFTIVYIPPHFKQRLFLFVVTLWTMGAICLGVAVALPILLGRGFFGVVFKGKREVHDGYSILIGFYMLWGCWIVGRAIDRLDKRRQRRGHEGPRASLWWLVVRRGLVWMVKALYMSLFLGVVIPALVGIVVELYLVLPLKLVINKDIIVPRIRVLDCWAMGLLYMKIAMRASRRQAHNPISRGIQNIKRNGWTHPDPINATKEVIAPVTGGLLGMTLLPGFTFYGLKYLFPAISRGVDDRFIFTHVYPGIFCLAGLTHVFVMLNDMLGSWSQTVRDKEFLVEMRLKNHDPEAGMGKLLTNVHPSLQSDVLEHGFRQANADDPEEVN